MKLYELREHYLAIQHMIEDGDDYTEDTLRDTLESIEDAIAVKAENIAKMIIHFQKQADAFKAEEQRLAGRRQTFENKIKYFKDFLLGELELAGIQKTKGDLLTVSRQNNSPSVMIDNADNIPPTFISIKTETVIDKKGILDAIKAGQEIPGARISVGQHLRIR